MTALRTAERQKLGRTREDIIEALQEYGATYGPGFTQASFSPSTAKWNDRPDLIERYYTPRKDGSRWPSLNGIKSLFPSFNDARIAAGFEPNTPGPARNRREANRHQPIRDVRERLVYVPNEKTADLTRRLHNAQDRALESKARAERAEAKVRDLLAERRSRVPSSTTQNTEVVKRSEGVARHATPEIRTVTKTVKVRDEKALERLQRKLEDEKARRLAVEDQLKASTREVGRLEASVLREKGKAADALAEAAESRLEAQRALEAAQRASDRLEAAEGRADLLRADLEDAREQVLGVSEAAAAHELVRQAEMRTEGAEIRAARAERQMVQMSQAVTGEQRKLTAGEMAELRKQGPAGPGELAKALKKLARARLETGGDLPKALMEVASAAVNWRDRIR